MYNFFRDFKCYYPIILFENSVGIEKLFCSDESTALSSANCLVLRKLLDDKWLCNPLVDFKLVLSPEELAYHIGRKALISLSERMQDTYDKIVLQRCTPEGLCIKFHLDNADRIMQVALNDDNEYTGGRLTFLTCDGKVHVPKRIAGSYTIHNNSIVHGVSEHTAGLRYGLFLIKERDGVLTENG